MSVLVQRNLQRNQINTLDTQMVAMTNSQFVSNNNISSSGSGSTSNSNNCINTTSTNNLNNNINNNKNINNKNDDGEPKYLHKKFKKMATAEMVADVKNENITFAKTTPVSLDSFTKKRDLDITKNIKESSRNKETPPDYENEQTETKKAGYVCPYCKLSCAKPSVLQKHIRAHTNERPYPCVPCGFAFKTKSNLYKHCRSRAHALKMEGSDIGKVSEDSDISLSDSASNGTGTPPPALTAASINAISNTKIVRTGKIYKPKFHTALQSINDTDSSPLPPSIPSTTSSSISMSSVPSISSAPSSSSSSSTTIIISKSNVEQLQEHIDKIITDNQAIVEAVDPRLHKLISQRQQSIEPKSYEPLNLSSNELDCSRKRCYSESFVVDHKEEQPNFQGSIIKDLLLKSREADEFTCNFCKIPYTCADNLETHRKYYCKSSPKDLQLNLEKKDEIDKVEYYSTIQPLPSPGPLLGNTRLVDAYPPNKRHKSELVPTSLRSLEELSKYPRPNSLQMFGGEVRILDNSGETKTMRIEPRQTNSPTSDDLTVSQVSQKAVSSETSSIVVRSGLHSGGTMVHKPPGTPVTTSSSSISLPNTPKMLAPIIPNISTPNLAPTMTCYNYFESVANSANISYPLPNLRSPVSSGITTILHGGKVIPYVPGIPGPHSLSATVEPPVQPSEYKIIPTIRTQPLNLVSSLKFHSNPRSNDNVNSAPLDPVHLPDPKIIKDFQHTPNGLINLKIPPKIDEYKNKALPNSAPLEFAKNDLYSDNHSPHHYVKSQFKYQERKEVAEKKTKNDQINYINNAPAKFIENRKRSGNCSDSDYFHPTSDSPNQTFFSATKEIPQENGKIIRLSDDLKPQNSFNGSCRINEPTPIVVINLDSKVDNENDKQTDKIEDKESEEENEKNLEISAKFLRPTSLPLKPGTFTPKKHHGITPTANTLPLISPETPRPRKSYGQLYLNGHAYTYLGLKCSTRVFYCTLNRPQPMYVIQQHGLSMYSNWKICKEAPPDLDMAHYDSRNRSLDYTIAWKKQDVILTHSSQRPTTPSTNSSSDSNPEDNENSATAPLPNKNKRIKIFDGGYKSNEDYTYVRGRGRGRYICEECGIRCKKPSMLKKHIRTHTDVRPYTCKHCTFSFKTKGNLTKHMKSKAHYKKCVELGVTPVPTIVCDDNIDKEAIAKLVEAGDNVADESSEEEEETDIDESDESGNEEQEAAQSLLSLSQPNLQIRLPGLVPIGRPLTYPYTLTDFQINKLPSSTVATSTINVTTVIQSEAANRYYFPSSKSVDDCRDSVIRSTNEDAEIDKLPKYQSPSSTSSSVSLQPMDLTTKTCQMLVQSTSPFKRPIAEILTPVAEPMLMQTIVQTMERLPVQGKEWKPDNGNGHMLQAYLTERHVMDSKMKQQCRIGNCHSRLDKKQITYSNVDFVDYLGSERIAANSIYTDFGRMQQVVMTEISSKKEKNVKVETTCERPDFDFLYTKRISESIHEDSLDENKRPNSVNYAIDNEKLPKNDERERDCSAEKINVIINNNNAIDDKLPKLPIITEIKLPNEVQEYIDADSKFNKDERDKRGTNINNNNNFIIVNNNKAEFRIKDDISPLGIVKMSEPKSCFPLGDLMNSDKSELKLNIDLTKQLCPVDNSLKHGIARKMIVGGPGFRSPSPSRGNSAKPQAEFIQPSSGHTPNYVSVTEDGRSVCGICNKIFSKPSQLRLHINIHYFERPFRCESCAVSFRTKGHLTKHERSVSHHNKVSMTSTFGAATTSNPRPFKCTDCKIAFRIHGHLAKHLRSKMHIMKLECLGKLPFGTYAEMERSGVNLNDIDTTDCDNSLASLQMLAQKLYEKDPSKMGQWEAEVIPHQGTSGGETSSDEGEPIPLNTLQSSQQQQQQQQQQQPYIPSISTDISVSRAYQTHNTLVSNDITNNSVSESHVPNLRFDDNSSSSSSTLLSSTSTLPYKCQMCDKSLTNINELKVHCFVEHNIEYNKIIQQSDATENIQKKIVDLINVPYNERNEHKNNDT